MILGLNEGLAIPPISSGLVLIAALGNDLSRFARPSVLEMKLMSLDECYPMKRGAGERINL